VAFRANDGQVALTVKLPWFLLGLVLGVLAAEVWHYQPSTPITFKGN